jgi:hypothetical protein
MHRLDLGVVLQSVGAEFATDTRLLEATEGSLIGANLDQVWLPPSTPRTSTLPSVCPTPSRLGRPNPIANLDSLGLILELGDGDDRTENLLLSYLHI